MAFRSCIRQITAVIFFLVSIVPNAFAGVYEFTSAPSAYDSPLSLGFQFTTNTAVTVTDLGYYDFLGDGFATSHNVGIFDLQGNLLTSISLSAGTVNSLNGDFRYGAITPFTLAANQSYVIAATSNGECPSCTAGRDPWVYGGPTPGPTGIVGFNVDPRITINPNAALFLYQSDNVLRYPTDHFSDYVIYAANFEIASAVPELSSWLMMLIGFAGVALLTYRRADRAIATI